MEPDIIWNKNQIGRGVQNIQNLSRSVKGLIASTK